MASNQTPARKKSALHWPAFTAETLRQLDQEGDINIAVDPTWTQAVLERRMLSWCDQEWGEAPSVSTVRKHVVAALRKFRASREAGN